MKLKTPILAVAFLLPFSAALADDPIELVDLKSVWKYLDQNIDPGPDWMQPFFDDSSWESGPGQLGFNEGDEATLIDRGTSPYPTSYYFRQTFDVSGTEFNSLDGDDGFYQLVLNLLRDDGAIVYINGVELLRDNVDASQSGGHETVAIAAVGGAAENIVYELVEDGSGYLQPGENLIAVSVHQNSPGSSDISFDLGLQAINAAPLFGVYRPPVDIDFNDAPIAYLDEYFDPDPLLGDESIGWEVQYPGAAAQPVSYGTTDFDPIFNKPDEGFVESFAFHINDGQGVLTNDTADPFDNPLKYRIDLRNYVDVEVSFGVRCSDQGGTYEGIFSGYPDGNGFESNDFFKYWHLTSSNGTEFTKTLGMELAGGGSGGLNFETVPLVKEADSKRGLVPTNGSLGVTWTQPGFNDSSWHQFTKGVGYDSGADYVPYIGWNTLSTMRNINASCYMRIPFTVDDKSLFEGLTLYARDDDGFVAYINGTRVFDVNGPVSPLWNSIATANNPDTSAINLKGYDISAHIDKLVDGENVLAIHGLNQPASSSDFLVSVELEGRTANQTPRNDPPESLNDVNFGIDGPLYVYTLPVPENTSSYIFEFEIRTDNALETIYMDNWTIRGTPLSVDSYASWIYLETNLEGDAADPYEDPDLDGIINYFEFAFGSDPEVASRTAADGGPLLPTVDIVEEAGQFYFELTWRQIDAGTRDGLDFPYGGYSVYDIRYIPQFSHDGEFWEDGRIGARGRLVIPPGETDEFVENGDGTISLRMRYRDPILVAGDDRPFFARLLIAKSIPILDF